MDGRMRHGLVAVSLLIGGCRRSPEVVGEPIVPGPEIFVLDVDADAGAEAPSGEAEPREDGAEPKAANAEAANADAEEAVQQMGTFAEAMCACRDKACAERLSEAMTAYANTLEKKYEGRPQPVISADQQARMQASVQRLTECVSQAFEESSPNQSTPR